MGLPDPDQPIDPAKRAPISTRDAVRPGANNPTGTGVVSKEKIRIMRAPVAQQSRNLPRSSIQVSETRAKQMRSVGVRRSPAARSIATRSAASLPASIPRLGSDRFQKILVQCRTGSTAAADLGFARAHGDRERIGLSEINRFANPRATLERQGIPVISAGSDPAEPAEAAPVPISREASTASP